MTDIEYVKVYCSFHDKCLHEIKRSIIEFKTMLDNMKNKVPLETGTISCKTNRRLLFDYIDDMLDFRSKVNDDKKIFSDVLEMCLCYNFFNGSRVDLDYFRKRINIILSQCVYMLEYDFESVIVTSFYTKPLLPFLDPDVNRVKITDYIRSYEMKYIELFYEIMCNDKTVNEKYSTEIEDLYNNIHDLLDKYDLIHKMMSENIFTDNYDDEDEFSNDIIEEAEEDLDEIFSFTIHEPKNKSSTNKQYIISDSSPKQHSKCYLYFDPTIYDPKLTVRENLEINFNKPSDVLSYVGINT